ncbi:Dinitrogenase iron-molybdenum cofactor biosynthesis [Magnetococcus marinus MC-1]|uniref:Dinitrogenase iron-molybdenum cofactor biosynthesis n=1 Tax=Magnetococcus marinus (strain ATCC BAA-1437 / JCM 17883 / MC-1) TaxID=156889 RepID=A0L6W6_MAGMM|nr:NifB/NifX family molybdenum-iron cluster-binding protein [Magnetococcus marinus]ABK43709.1 Dinitrogenase iron-molybdenum cofactor biosynthesis [Magnetococcus marinus MC-1]
MAKNTELALRMGVAAKQITGLEPKALVAILQELVELPFTPLKFSQLRLADLSQALGDSADPAQVQAAHKILVEGLDPQIVETLSAQDAKIPREPNAVRVACASSTPGQTDGHFGGCKAFEIYDVSPGAVTLVESRSTLHLIAEKITDDPAYKSDPRVALINDCDLVFVVSIGGPAAAKVVRAGMHPMKFAEGGSSEALLADLQQTLTNNPPPWLAKVMAGSVTQQQA